MINGENDIRRDYENLKQQVGIAVSSKSAHLVPVSHKTYERLLIRAKNAFTDTQYYLQKLTNDHVEKKSPTHAKGNEPAT